MKAVILAGGFGTRISEESYLKPKPMIEIGGRPILWHIMKIYSAYGVSEFIICCGYKGYVIKEYFANYFLHMSDVTFDIKSNKMKIHQNYSEPWQVTLVDTGYNTMTGGRLKLVKDYLKDDTFFFTYGDGLSNLNISELIKFHHQQKTLATITSIQLPGKFGAMEIENDRVISFMEKPQGDGMWISGGFFVLEPAVIDLIEDEKTVWEKGPMEKLVADGALSVFKHSGFWAPMDTLRDQQYLEKLWASGNPPWKVWE